MNHFLSFMTNISIIKYYFSIYSKLNNYLIKNILHINILTYLCILITYKSIFYLNVNTNLP